MGQHCPKIYAAQTFRYPRKGFICWPILCSSLRLAGRHSLGHETLESKLLLLEVLGGGVLNLKLGHGVRKSRLDALLVATLQLHGQGRLGDHLLNTGDVGLELLAGLELLGESLVGALELVGVVNHLLDLTAGQLADSVGDGDVGGTAGGLLSGGDLQDTVDINLEDGLQSGLTGAHGGKGSEGELSQGGVVGTVGTLTLVDGELDGALVVNNSGEGTLLDGRDGLATGNDGGEDVALHGDTKGERNDIQKQKVLGLGGGSLAGEDTGLDGGTVGNGLIGVDALLELLAIEEVGQELLDTGDTGGTTDKDDLIDLGLLDTRVLQDLLDRVKGAGEGLGVQVLETGTGDGGVEVLTIEERVNLDGGLGSVGESTLGTLAGGTETTKGTGIAGQILLGLTLELLLEVVKEVGVEILTTKVSVTSGGLDGEDTTLDVQQGNIESTTTQIVDEDVALLVGLAGAQTVSNSGSSGLVDDTENVQASNGTGILGSLTLVVVEVGGDSDDGLLNLLAELGLSNLLHLFDLLVNCGLVGMELEPRLWGKLAFMRTMEEISWGVKVLFSPRYSTSTAGEVPWSTTLKGQDSTSFLTMGSSKRRPIRRLGKFQSEILFFQFSTYFQG